MWDGQCVQNTGRRRLCAVQCPADGAQLSQLVLERLFDLLHSGKLGCSGCGWPSLSTCACAEVVLLSHTNHVCHTNHVWQPGSGFKLQHISLQDCAMHPTQPLLAAALVSGRLEAYRFDANDATSTSALGMKASRSPVLFQQACSASLCERCGDLYSKLLPHGPNAASGPNRHTAASAHS